MLREIARTYAKAETATILWGMGVCQFRQGVETVRALASLAMLTGNLGKTKCWGKPSAWTKQRTGCVRYGRVIQHITRLSKFC